MARIRRGRVQARFCGSRARPDLFGPTGASACQTLKSKSPRPGSAARARAGHRRGGGAAAEPSLHRFFSYHGNMPDEEQLRDSDHEKPMRLQLARLPRSEPVQRATANASGQPGRAESTIISVSLRSGSLNSWSRTDRARGGYSGMSAREWAASLSPSLPAHPGD